MNICKETQHVHLLKQNYGFYSNQVITEFERMRTLNGIRHKNYVMNLSQNHSDILADVKIHHIINLYSFMSCGQIYFLITVMYMTRIPNIFDRLIKF
jgi:hypothetical protein